MEQCFLIFTRINYCLFIHLYSFSHRPHSLLRVKKTESYLLSLPQHHQKLLSKYREHLQEVKRCIENNDQIIKLIIKDVAHIFENVCPSTAQVDSVRNIRLI
jgi:carnosine N-methyltransferase